MSGLLLNLTQNVATQNSWNSSSVLNSLNQPTVNSVPLFNGSKDTLTVTTWLRKIKQLAAVYNWSEATMIYAATTRLEEYAGRWYEGRTNYHNP